ncbi:MAG: DNA-J related domain-containing protein [Bermanella sp.]
MFNFDLSTEIECYLITNPSCNEYQLVQHLQKLGRLPSQALRQPLSLFRCHFLIYNALYRLQYLTHVHQRYQLSISSIQIEMSIYSASKNSHEQYLDQYSSLALFYMDTTQLNQTTEQDINRLLDQFWQDYLSPDRKISALNTLEINPTESESIDFKGIKKQYRRLVMKHHPDRGGNAQKMIDIHQALQCLQQYYQA